MCVCDIAMTHLYAYCHCGGDVGRVEKKINELNLNVIDCLVLMCCSSCLLSNLSCAKGDRAGA